MELPYHFKQYVLTHEIAQGGMAVVYRGKHLGEEGFTKDVAVKRILPAWSQDAAFIAMLIDEAKMLTQLEHPNIVQVFELGVDGSTYYFVMEYVAGLDLRTLLNLMREHGMALPERYTYAMMMAVLQGLSFAHAQTDVDGEPLRIVHRDISPQNILVAFHGGVKIADFGIAKGGERRYETRGMQVKGKYAYMAPEQARGDRVDRRADLYAVGLVFYELLTGRCVFDGPNDLAVLARVRDAKFSRNFLQHVHPRMRPILRRALAPNPDDRYATASAFLSDLSTFVNDYQCMATTDELGAYLQQVFPDLAKSTQQVIKTPLPQSREDETAVHEKVVPPLHSFRTVLSSFLLLCGLLTMQDTQVHAEAASVLERQNAAGFARVALPRPLPVDRLALLEESKPELKAVSVLSEHEPEDVPTVVAPGELMLGARPWAYVSIPGILQSRETPVRTHLAPGEYDVHFRSPAGHTASAKVLITSDARAHCRGSFMGKARVVCDG